MASSVGWLGQQANCSEFRLSGNEDVVKSHHNKRLGLMAILGKVGALGFLWNRSNGVLFKAHGDYRLFQTEVGCLGEHSNLKFG